MIDREKKWGDEMRCDLPWIEAAGGPYSGNKDTIVAVNVDALMH